MKLQKRYEVKEKIKWNWMKAWVLVLSLTGIPEIVQADVSNILLKFQPYISVQEEYTNNLNLTPNNKENGFITTVTAGLNYSTSPAPKPLGEPILTPTTEAEKYGVDLSGQVGFVYYAKGKAENYLSLGGTLNTWYTWANRLTLRLDEYIVRSDEQRELVYPGALPPQYGSGTAGGLPNQYLPGTQRVRSIWFRNVFSPSMEYQFSKDGQISLRYLNNIYINQSDFSQNSQENYINPKLTYWFDIQNGISLEYGYTIGNFIGNFPSSQDMTGQMVHGQYTYRFNPRTSIFANYVYTMINYDPPGIDYNVNSPSLGINHQFSPTFSGTAQAGYFWRSPERGKGSSGPTVNISLTQRGDKTTYSLLLRGGYQINLFTAQNLGFTEYYTAIGTVSYQLMEKVTTGLSGSFEWDKWKNTGVGALVTPNQRDNIWTISGNLSYELLRWLNLSFNLSYNENNSNISTQDYNEFRALMSVAATYK